VAAMLVDFNMPRREVEPLAADSVDMPNPSA
jgi:hypothetical protein